MLNVTNLKKHDFSLYVETITSSQIYVQPCHRKWLGAICHKVKYIIKAQACHVQHQYVTQNSLFVSDYCSIAFL